MLGFLGSLLVSQNATYCDYQPHQNHISTHSRHASSRRGMRENERNEEKTVSRGKWEKNRGTETRGDK